MLLLIIILLVILILFLFLYKKTVLKRCKKSDIECIMYNHRDINSKCTRLCQEYDSNLIFTGNLQQDDDEYICECNYAKEPFTLDFTNVGENPDILPDVVPDDMKFSDRNYAESVQEKRYNSLIFG